MSKYLIGATSDIGCERENQEDFIQYKELDDNNILLVIADGTGTTKEHLQPAIIITMNIINEITDIFNRNKSLFVNNASFFIERALLNANDVLGAFKLGNEELYSGYAASVLVAFFSENNTMHISNAGNTRLYILRNSNIVQLTKDHTDAQRLFDEGQIDEETYYIHPSRLKMTSGIGILLNPEIDSLSGSIQENDIFILTTDGVHYAIRPDAIKQIVLESNNVENASQNLIMAAKDIVKYPDNMSAMALMFNKQV